MPRNLEAGTTNLTAASAARVMWRWQNRASPRRQYFQLALRTRSRSGRWRIIRNRTMNT